MPEDAASGRPGTASYLCFDYGEKRIGVAIGQELTRTAEALVTLEVKRGHIDWDAIARLVESWRPDGFVVGRPCRDDGSPYPVVVAVERFARRLEGRFRRPVTFVDERLTSYAARGGDDAARFGLDAAAARHMLESWLASR